MDGQLIVGIKDAKGRLILEQPYEDYVRGEKNIAMSIYSYGQKLFDILNDELGYIRLENNIFAFNYIFMSNVQEVAMRLLGKIAEAIIVRRCNEDADINRK